MSWKKVLITIALVIVVLIVAVNVFLSFYDLNRFKPVIARAVQGAIGRELTVGGDIDIKPGLIPALVAEDVSLENAPWGSRPQLATVKRLEVTISLLPLIWGDYKFIDLVLIEPDVILEINQNGKTNFHFQTSSDDEEKTGGDGKTALPVLIFSDIRIKDGLFTYRDGKADKKYAVGFDRLQGEIPGLDESLELDFEGTVQKIPLSIKGTFGPIAAWIEPGIPLPVDLKAMAFGASFSVKGESRKPRDFKDLDFTLTAEGTSTLEILKQVGVTDIPELGAFQIEGKVVDPEGRLALEKLDVNIGSQDLVEVLLSGAVRDLLALQKVDIHFSLQGKDAMNLPKIGLPAPLIPGPFHASGRISDAGPKNYKMSDVKALAGDSEASGEMSFNFAGPAPSLTADVHYAFGKTTGIAEGWLKGTIQDLPKLEGVDVTARIHGRDLTRVGTIIGQPLPLHGPFDVSGKVTMPHYYIVSIPDVEIRLGKNIVSGSLDLDQSGEIPVLSAVLSAPKFNLHSILAPEMAKQNWAKALKDMGPTTLAFKLSGFAGGQVAGEDMDLHTGRDNLSHLRLNGSVKNLRDQEGVDLDFTVRGIDAANLSEFIGQPLPVQGAYAVSGKVNDPGPKNYRVSDLDITLGENNIAGSLDVNLADKNPLISADLSSKEFNLKPLSSVNNNVLAKFTEISDLGPLRVKVKVAFPPDTVTVEQLDLTAGKQDLAEMELEGTVENLLASRGMDLKFSARGKDAANLEVLTGQSLPVQGAYAVSGQLNDPAAKNFKVSNMKLTLGENNFTGWLDVNLAGKQTQLASELSTQKFTLQPLTIPALKSLSSIPDLGPLRLAVKLTGSGEKLTIENLDLTMGRDDLASVMLKGTIGEMPPAQGVALDFSVSGSDLSNLEKAGGPDLPIRGSFSVSGTFADPSPQVYQVDSLQVALGDNDAEGSFTLDMSKKKPKVVAALSSQRLDFRPLLEKDEKSDGGKGQPEKTERKKDKVFSSEPWDLDALNMVDADVKIRGDNFLFPSVAFNNIKIDFLLEEGDLKVKPVNFIVGGGSAEGQFHILSNQQIPQLSTEMTIENLDIGPMLKELGYEETAEGKLNAHADLTGQGNSMASLMAGLNGEFSITVTDGRIHSEQLNLLQGFLGSGVLQIINPFRERIDSTKVNCFVSHEDIKDGIVDPKILLDTQQTSIIVAGDINLKTEALNLGIQPTPKSDYSESIGFSFNFSRLSQPFRVGGMLANPVLEIDPTSTAITLGKFAGAAALGPGGLALFFSEISVGEKDLCAELLKEPEDGQEGAAGEELEKAEESRGFFRGLFNLR